jgi:N-methylhydantoinase A
VYFGPDLGWRDTPIIDRPDLATPRAGGAAGGVSPPGRLGPCIVEEYDATCVIPPGARAALDAHGNIVIESDVEGWRSPE